jgi:cytochrome c553
MLRKWLKRLGYAMGGLVSLLLVTYLVVHVMATFRMERKYAVTHETVDVPAGAEAVARGKHVVEAMGHCNGCHGADFGGTVMLDSFAIGKLVAPNLTTGRGGRGAALRTEDWVRALRHGLSRDGHPLKVMPSEAFQHLSREDLGAIIAYMRTVAPVDKDLGATHIGPLGRALFVFGVLPLLSYEAIDHEAAARFSPPVGPTAEYGRYLAGASGCLACHGAELQGGKSPAPGFPAPPRLARLGELGWGEADFVRALRTGTRPDGRVLGDSMPWRAIGQMNDTEIAALWRFINDGAPTAMAR